MATANIRTKAGKGRGNIEGLTKHLAKKYGGDPHFFTKCMAAEELQGYPEENRSGICARAHKIATGIWPGEHGGENPSGPEKKEMSKDMAQRLVSNAWSEHMRPSDADMKAIPSAVNSYTMETYDTHVVIYLDSKYYDVPYTMDVDNNVTFADRTQWKEVKEKKEWVEILKQLQEGKKHNFIFHKVLPSPEDEEMLKDLPTATEEELKLALMARYGGKRVGHRLVVQKRAPKIIAKRGENGFMIDVGGGKCIVINKATGEKSSLVSIQSVLARGYWKNYDEQDPEIIGLLQ